MGVIFFLSAQPNLRTELGTIDLIGRKVVHMVEFGLLFVLWLRAFGWQGRAAWWGAAAIAVGYAISDEFHQSFVDGRQGAPRDVAIDTAGVVLAALLLAKRSPFLARTQRASWAPAHERVRTPPGAARASQARSSRARWR